MSRKDIFWWCLSMTIFLVFLVLKLIGIIAWKWVWVVSPLWIFYGNAIVLSVVIVLIFKFRLKQLEKSWELERRKR